MANKTLLTDVKVRTDLGSIKDTIETRTGEPDFEKKRHFENEYVKLVHDKLEDEYSVTISDEEPYGSNGTEQIGKVTMCLTFGSALQIKSAAVAPTNESGCVLYERKIQEPGLPRFVAKIIEHLQLELPSETGA